jgi:hypothetical protein
VTVFAGLFLFVFGGLGVWLFAKHFPAARFMRNGYAAMSLGGLLFVAWALTRVLGIGVAAAVFLLAGGTLGAIGAFRRELRMTT